MAEQRSSVQTSYSALRLNSLSAFQYFVLINLHHTLWDFSPQKSEYPINHMAGKLQKDLSVGWSLLNLNLHSHQVARCPLCSHMRWLTNPEQPTYGSPPLPTLWRTVSLQYLALTHLQTQLWKAPRYHRWEWVATLSDLQKLCGHFS